MIEGVLSSLRRTGERVQRRGEEVAQATRLRLEIFQLGRELDGLYARLGRAYHGHAEVETLEGIREEIARVDQEISAREALVRELNAHPQAASASTPTPPPPAGAAPASPPPAPDRPAADTALSIWNEKETARMTKDQDSQKMPAPNPENADPLDPTKAGVSRAPDAPATDAPLGDRKAEPTDDTASMGDEAARDEMVRHKYMLEEGEAASRSPDPLANKGE